MFNLKLFINLYISQSSCNFKNADTVRMLSKPHDYKTISEHPDKTAV